MLHSSHGWMRSTIRCRHKRAALDTQLPEFSDFISVIACAASSRAAAAMEEATRTSRAALRPGTAAVVKISAGGSSGFRSGARVCKFHAADHSMDACPVSTCGFGVAASFFCVLQLRVQEALSLPFPQSVSKPLLNIGNEVVRRQDTSHASVDV